jgi:hypothetical protein
MLKTLILLLVLATCVVACAHRGAVRVECEGPLRPINRTDLKPPGDGPVSVVPAKPDSHPDGAPRP